MAGGWPIRWSEQAVFQVTVAHGPGQVRTGWVRCGGFWAGLFGNRAEVRWQDTSDAGAFRVTAPLMYHP